MSKVQMVRALVQQRLTAAAEEIFVLFERTIAEYEEELCRSKEEKERQQKLLEAVFKPQLQLHRTDVQQLSVRREVVPPEQQEEEERPSLDQEDPGPPQIKEEKKELWVSQEEEQLQELEEADIRLTHSSVKSEDEEEKPQSSWFHGREGEESRAAEHWEAEPNTDSEPGSPLPPDHLESLSSETDDSRDWDETENIEELLSSEESNPEKTSHRAAKRAGNRKKKPYRCPICGKAFAQRYSFRRHSDKVHSRQTSYTCRICKQHFVYSVGLERHMRIHPGEKPFSCSVCEKTFVKLSYLKQHSHLHTGATDFSCSVCQRTFAKESYLTQHMLVHTSETPFGCSVCDKKFTHKCTMKRHMTLHTGERFSCNVCNKTFTRPYSLKSHKCLGKSSKIHEPAGKLGDQGRLSGGL